MAQIFVSVWLTFSLALVAQIFASAWLKYSLTFTLLPEWGTFTQGIVIGAVGLAVLLIMVPVRRKMDGKPGGTF